MMSNAPAPAPRLADAPVRRPARAVVLLVEDNPGDAELTLEGLADSPVIEDVHVVHDGAEALDFLRRAPKYADAPLPDLILLDLNLPRLGGHGVLAEVGADPALRHIPVVVLSSSLAEDDIERAYALGARGYVAKALDLDVHMERIRSVEGLWREVAGAA